MRTDRFKSAAQFVNGRRRIRRISRGVARYNNERQHNLFHQKTIYILAISTCVLTEKLILTRVRSNCAGDYPGDAAKRNRSSLRKTMKLTRINSSVPACVDSGSGDGTRRAHARELSFESGEKSRRMTRGPGERKDHLTNI